MKRKRKKGIKRFSIRYAIYGALIGLCFPIVATYIYYGEISIEHCPFILTDDTPSLFFIIDTAPLVLAIFAWFAGTKMDKIQRQNILLNERFNQLIQQKETIEDSVNVKEKFMSKMSHELRTPMNSIIGLSELLKETELEEEQMTHVDVIYKESRQLLELINDVLDLAKLNSDKFQFVHKSFNLKKVLKDKITALEISARQEELKISLKVDEDVATNVIGDKRRVVQVVTNVMNNSIKFTERGNIDLEISLEKETEKLQILLFKFKDTGRGINQENLEMVFQPFVQSGSGAKVSEGTGLGLAIVHELVTGMKGSISLESNLGKGTEISIVIPFEKVDKQITAMQEKELDDSLDLSNCEILIVEDNMFNLYLLESILSKWNVSTSTAENGQVALEILKNKKFDLVLMDFQMPILDGIEATRLIRSELKLNIPIIGLSAVTMESEIQEAYAAGVDDYLPKPIDRIVLKDKIQRAIAK